MKFKYLLIGNSSAGIGAAEAIREIDPQGSLAIISDEPYHTYGRPMISYYLADETSEKGLLYRSKDFYEKKQIKYFSGRKVVRLNPGENQVILENEEKVEYLKLLLAVGGKPILPPIKALEIEGVYTFISLNDAKKIKNKLKDIKKVVILGAGLIGLKAAEALRQKKVEVTAVELADRVLSPVLDEVASSIVEKILKENGIEIITKNTIDEITGAKKASGVILKDKQKIPCDAVIIAVGIKPNLEIIADTKIKTNRGIIVDEHMLTSIKNIYAAGDVVEAYDFIYEQQRLTPILPNAYFGGRIAGFNMTGENKKYETQTFMNSVDFFGFPIISAGLFSAENKNGYEILSRFEPENNIYKKFVLKNNRLLGMILTKNIDCAGIYLSLMKEKNDVSAFKDKLLSDDIGLVWLPKEKRAGKLS